MAIRIGPPPVLARLRHYCHFTYTQYLRQRRSFDAGFERMFEPCRRSGRRVLLLVQPGERQRMRRQAEFDAFVVCYEDLVSLLCRAAKEGVSADQDQKYVEIQDWMQRNYYKVRPRVQPFLEPWEGPLDPFEELFSAYNVESMINDTSSLFCVMQTRSALEASMAANVDLQAQ